MKVQQLSIPIFVLWVWIKIGIDGLSVFYVIDKRQTSSFTSEIAQIQGAGSLEVRRDTNLGIKGFRTASTPKF
jgi:hypothetical protein